MVHMTISLMLVSWLACLATPITVAQESLKIEDIKQVRDYWDGKKTIYEIQIDWSYYFTKPTYVRITCQFPGVGERVIAGVSISDSRGGGGSGRRFEKYTGIVWPGSDAFAIVRVYYKQSGNNIEKKADERRIVLTPTSSEMSKQQKQTEVKRQNQVNPTQACTIQGVTMQMVDIMGLGKTANVTLAGNCVGKMLRASLMDTRGKIKNLPAIQVGKGVLGSGTHVFYLPGEAGPGWKIRISIDQADTGWANIGTSGPILFR